MMRESKVSQRIFDVLCAHPYGVPMRRLVELVYADRADGGPEWNSVVVLICLMNKRWERRGVGLRIRCRGYQGYKIWIVRPSRISSLSNSERKAA